MYEEHQQQDNTGGYNTVKSIVFQIWQIQINLQHDNNLKPHGRRTVKYSTSLKKNMGVICIFTYYVLIDILF